MSETLVWLLYCVAGVLSYAAVKFRRWNIIVATLASAALATAIWATWYWLTGDEDRPPWFRVHLSLNAFFILIFAGAGAALGDYVAHRNRKF